MNEWKTVRLGDVLIQQDKSKIKAGEGIDDGIYPFYTCSNELTKRINTAQYKGPALIFGTGGKASVHFCSEDFSTSTDCLVYKTNKDVNLSLINKFLRNNIYLLENGFKGAGLQHISRDYIANIEIPLPNILEQNKLVTQFDLIESTIANHKSMLQKYDTLIKSRFIEMFGDNPVESGKWEVETLADVCSSVVRGPFGSALKKDVFVPKSNNTVKVYEQKHAIQKSANIGTYYISQEKYEELKRFECKPGDFIMSCSGTMGEFYQLPIGCEKGIINQALCKFSLNNKIEALFFLEWMKQSIHNLETKGSGIQNVAAVSFIKQIPVFLPPLTLQKQFSSFVQQIDKSKFTVQKSLEKTETLYKSLIHEYFG